VLTLDVVLLNTYCQCHDVILKTYCELFTDYSSEEERDHSSSDDSEIDGMSCDGMTEDDGPKKAATKEEKLVNTFIS
jgi:hypothetical protein